MLPVSESERPRRVADPAAEASRRFDRLALAIVFVAALLWRAVWAATLPCIARDGVTFCTYAQNLSERGVEFLQSSEAQQHPLYPLCVIAAQRVLRTGGFADSPLLWQNAGQLVSWLAHAGVLLLTAALAVRIVRSWNGGREALAPDPAIGRHTPLIAMLLAALLPMHAWLGAEAMSDELHLLCYLGAILLMCGLPDWRNALAAGALSGLAFLTRPEGAALVFVAMVGLLRVAARLRTRAVALALVLAGFLACAGPYWQVVGKFSSKKDPLATKVLLAAAERPATAGRPVADCGSQADESCASPALAKLERTNHAWYAVLPEVLHQLLRCGRVVIPLLGIGGLLLLMRRSALPRTLIVAAILGHLSLCAWLLHRHDYLDQRHLLPVVALLTPMAAVCLLLVRAPSSRHRAIFVGVACFPLAWYSLHRPNMDNRIWPLAARKLMAIDRDVARKPIVTGSSGNRLAFYCGSRRVPWFEYPEDYPAITQTLEAAGGGYFAIELGENFETRGNRELLARLAADPSWSTRLHEVLRITGMNPQHPRELRILRISPHTHDL